MQASKIVIGATYAIGDDDALARFIVKRIVTTRNQNGPSGLSSLVYGFVHQADRALPNLNPSLATGDEIALDPDHIHGEWSNYQALVARQRQEADQREQEARATRERRATAAKELRRMLGIDDDRLVKEYYSGVVIADEALDLLIEKLTELEIMSA